MTDLLFCSNMRPCHFPLQVIYLVLSFTGLLCFFEACDGFIVCSLKVRDNLCLVLQDPLCLRDVLETSGVLVAELTKLSSSQKELRAFELWDRFLSVRISTLYLSVGVEALKNCLDGL